MSAYATEIGPEDHEEILRWISNIIKRTSNSKAQPQIDTIKAAHGKPVIHVNAMAPWEICRIFARERHRLSAAGMLIPDFDFMIGATAAGALSVFWNYVPAPCNRDLPKVTDWSNAKRSVFYPLTKQRITRAHPARKRP